MAKSLALIIGMKPKGKDKSKPEAEESDDSETEYAELAFDALRDGDKGAFTEALIGAIKACVNKEEAGEYEDESA